MIVSSSIYTVQAMAAKSAELPCSITAAIVGPQSDWAASQTSVNQRPKIQQSAAAIKSGVVQQTQFKSDQRQQRLGRNRRTIGRQLEASASKSNNGS
ncbi:hypothetical protein ACLOJK_024503 [Asimina triloba]